MKKILYGSTALVAAGLLVSGAEAAEKIKLGVGGYFQQVFVAADEDDGLGTDGVRGTADDEPAANRRSHGFAKELEIHFKGSTVMDNGIEVGADVQLEAYVNGDQIDEQYIWFEGSFGKIVLGSEDNTAYLMHYAATTASPLGGVHSPNFVHFASGAGNAAAGFYSTRPGTGDADKISYFTPRWAGFQFGASYAPDNADDSATVALANDQGVGAQGEVIALSANYLNTFGGVQFGLSAGYVGGNLEAQNAANSLDDLEIWAFGARLGYMGWLLSGSYSNNDLGTNNLNNLDDRDNYDIALMYTTGPWSASIGYGLQEVNYNAAVNGKDEQEIIEVAGAYALSPGVQLSAGLQFVNQDASNNAGNTLGRTAANIGAAENDATVFFVGTALTF